MATQVSKLHKATTKAQAAKVRKAKLVVTKKAKDTATLLKLKPVAKEINIRLEKAMTIEAKADDHRLSAALQLAKAKTICEKQSLNFKKWAEANLVQSFETIRKLVRIGEAKHPAQALTDMRAGARASSAKNRTKATRGISNGPAAPIEERKSPFARATAAVEELDVKASLNLATDIAAVSDMVVIGKDELATLKSIRAEKKPAEKSKVAAWEAMTGTFHTLDPSAQMAFVKWAAKKVGVTVSTPSFDAVEDRPDFLDRSKKHGGKRKPKTVKRGAVA